MPELSHIQQSCLFVSKACERCCEVAYLAGGRLTGTTLVLLLSLPVLRISHPCMTPLPSTGTRAGHTSPPPQGLLPTAMQMAPHTLLPGTKV